jgi:hypothetical protein
MTPAELAAARAAYDATHGTPEVVRARIIADILRRAA